MKVTIVGTGYVGLVTGVGLAHIGHHVTCFDIDREKISQLKKGELPIYEPGLYEMMEEAQERLFFTSNPSEAYADPTCICIAVGTPPIDDGSANLQFVTEACLQAACLIQSSAIVVMKSTVPVGTNRYLQELMRQQAREGVEIDIVSNPEFLREGVGVHDFFHHHRIVIGAMREEAADQVATMYAPLTIPIFRTDLESAEMIKYASNAFLATKISFINEIAAICEKTGADIGDVAAGMGMDHRIGPDFLHAGIGYGGSCFPKDTRALVQMAGHVEHDFQLLRAVIDVNNERQSSLVKKALAVTSLYGKRVAVLGLAFKPNTDDIREAPAVTIITQLLEAGASIVAYDPKAIYKMKKIFPDLTYSQSVDDAIEGADATFIVTEWTEISEYPLERYERLMRTPLIFDGRNCYSLEEVQKYAISYYSMGRKTIVKR